MDKINLSSIHLISISLLISTFLGCAVKEKSLDVVDIDRERILKAAEIYLQEDPVTVTASQCERSYGGNHDFYSEGDYWWPDPGNPQSPYMRKDGKNKGSLKRLVC
jgi:hypothetical protein